MSNRARGRLRTFACLLLASLSQASPALAQDFGGTYIPSSNRQSVMLNGPKCLELPRALVLGPTLCNPEIHQQFLDAIRAWRASRKFYIGYNSERYDTPELKWTQSNFIAPQVMVEDRYLYDPVAGKYTVDRYLNDLETRYGGIDSVLLWPVYPNLGIDNRNQHDMIAAMPGGLAGVKQMVADFHRRGVRVMFPMMMWDQGTRDPGKPWPQAIAELMAELGVDGVNGDTQQGVPLAFPLAADRTGHPLAFQPELSPNDEALAWNLFSWWEEGPEVYASFAPKINRFKWLEPRHMANIIDRWTRDKTDQLQAAFFNGAGWVSWENIWGYWNGITPRDGEAVRRMATIERGVAPFLVSPDWEPFAPMRQFGIYASRWPLKDQTVWTIVNRNEYDVTGGQLSVPFREGESYYDLYHGVELQAERAGDVSILSFPIEAHGYGAVLAVQGRPGAEFVALMTRMKAMTAKPLVSFSDTWRELPQHMVPIAQTKPAKTVPSGMVEIPAAEFDFAVRGREIEGDNRVGMDVIYPWETTARRNHRQKVKIARFFLDKYPVTNAQFKSFLDATRYHPRDDINFLKDWTGGTYPSGWANKPVTWVSIEDARAYAAWAGKRLPHEWEWQYAAQGTDGRTYPWGNDWNAAFVPVPHQGRTLRGPDDSDAHPQGASPFGVMDMVGNVWQWTDEYLDDHTRAAILRGGTYYQPQGSIWYFPQTYRNDEHGKLLLMAPSKDRAGTLGFRCASDP